VRYIQASAVLRRRRTGVSDTRLEQDGAHVRLYQMRRLVMACRARRGRCGEHSTDHIDRSILPATAHHMKSGSVGSRYLLGGHASAVETILPQYESRVSDGRPQYFATTVLRFALVLEELPIRCPLVTHSIVV
jgi:hypothetical protein